jgi:maltooligosyltrehalose trehalohydrolase
MPVGAEVGSTGEGVHFRVWAPDAKSVDVVLTAEKISTPLTRESAGYYSGLVPQASAGSLYKYRLDGGEAFPDPASRFQPEGPHGPSEVVDPHNFEWTDQNWAGVNLPGQVIYELHIGTFTKEGTWRSAIGRLEYLKETGITVIELMPVPCFPGRFGWGYDGVFPFAPVAIYGSPNDFRLFVDRAHALGIGVILDVVYNHLGPDGNYLPKFSASYFSEELETDWGAAINFDGKRSGPVREYFRENACYWIREFHLDGLRLDATQDIHDNSSPHIITELISEARKTAGKRSIIVVAENEPQQCDYVARPDEGGHGADGLWNDDYHHCAMVALTGRSDAYYTDYRGTAQEFVSALKYGYLYQGQWYQWQEKRRGTPSLHVRRPAMITFIQNHDQVANSARGKRISDLTSPGRLRAMTAVTLLGPGTPMLFQGQEFAASSPFLFFADHKPELAKLVKKGRREFLAQWRGLALPEMEPVFASPSDPATFERCKLDPSEVQSHKEIYQLHRDLLKLRREDPVISKQGADGLDGAVLSSECFILRYFTPNFSSDRLLVVNLGRDLHFNPAPEPLLAPPCDAEWGVLWSSESPKYGGTGTPPLDSDQNWRIPGHAAVVLEPQHNPKPHSKQQDQTS